MELFTLESKNKCNQGYQSPLNQVKSCSCNIKSFSGIYTRLKIHRHISVKLNFNWK